LALIQSQLLADGLGLDLASGSAGDYMEIPEDITSWDSYVYGIRE